MHFVSALEGVVGGVIASALVTVGIFIYSGKGDVLALAGSLIGSAVTAASIYAAWRHGSKQLASQKELENWKIIFDIFPKIEGDEQGLRDAYLIIDLTYIHLLKDIPDSEIFTIVASSLGEEHSVGANIKNAVDIRISAAPEDIRKRLTEIVSSCQNISKIARMIEAMPSNRQPPEWEKSTRINRSNIARRCVLTLKEISVRLEELDDLRFLYKEGRARAVAQIRQTIQAQK